jgi:hypothetical protein
MRLAHALCACARAPARVRTQIEEAHAPELIEPELLEPQQEEEDAQVRPAGGSRRLRHCG